MNKKIASEIAVGVILLLAILVGGLLFLRGKKDEKITESPVVKSETPLVKSNINEEIEIPNTFPIATAEEIQNWKTYSNKKYGYMLRFPENLDCSDAIDGEGAAGDPGDVFTCDNSGNDRMFIFIQPLKLAPNQKQITFNTMDDIVMVNIKNNDVISSISETIKGADNSFAQHKLLKDLVQLNTDNFKPFKGVEKIVGFAFTDVSQMQFIGRDGGRSERAVHTYGRVWYFVKGNVLFQMFTNYDDVWPTADFSYGNFRNKVEQEIPNLEKIFSTITFSKSN